MATNPTPVALTIAGSDSGGGAGIQADLKTFSALGVFGTSAITAITAQNPAGVHAIQGIQPEVVSQQIKAVLDYFPVGVIKTGMLFSAEIIHAVADSLPNGQHHGEIPMVVDPVMVATSGAKLLGDDALEVLLSRILPHASLITPNMDEAALLSDRTLENADDLEPAARAIFDRFGVPVLVKGGHLTGVDETMDVLWDGRTTRIYRSPFVAGVDTHGTGCTLASAIAIHLLADLPLGDAIAAAKTYLQGTLTNALPISIPPKGKGASLNHGFAPKPLKPT